MVLLVSSVRCAFLVLEYLIIYFRTHLFFLVYNLRISLICFGWIRDVLSVLIHVILLSSHTLHGIPLYLIVLFSECHVLALVELSLELDFHILSIRLLHFLRFIVNRFRLLLGCELLFMISNGILFVLNTAVCESQEWLYTDIISTD